MEFNALQIGEAALGRTSQQIAQTSHSIARQPVQEAQPQASAQATPAPVKSLTQEMIQLRVEQHQGESAAKIIRTADETIGTLLDVKA